MPSLEAAAAGACAHTAIATLSCAIYEPRAEV